MTTDPTTVGSDDTDGTFELFASDTQELPVKLTTQEQADRGQELAQLGVLIEEREANRREVMAELKGEIDGLKAEASKLRTSVADGEEPRPVVVEKWGNHTANLIRYVRTDTGDVVEERAMEADERQGSLFDGSDDGDDSDDGDTWGDDDALQEGEADPVLPPEAGDDAPAP